MTRKELLLSWLRLDSSVENLRKDIASLEFDVDEPVVELNLMHILNILDRFIAGSLTAVEVEEWANGVECRDDIGFDKKREALLRDVIYKLSNPLLTQKITLEYVVQLKSILKKEANLT